MALYCLCQKEAIREIEKSQVMPDQPTIVCLDLNNQFNCIKTGAVQVLNDGHRHYPNVDVYQCMHCGVIIAKDK